MAQRRAVDDLVARLVRAREALLASVAGREQTDLDRRVGERWSAGMVLDHLAQSESGVVKVIHKLLRESPGPAKEEPPDQSHRLDFAHLEDRTRPMDAPDIVLPRVGRPRDDLLRDLAASRVALLDLARQMPERDLAGRTFPHPLLGALDAYQWLLFVSQHEARHTAQIREAT